jgi:hypothetical protein
VNSLNEQVSQLRLELLKEQEARISEESFYAQTKQELSRSRDENEQMWKTLRDVQKDHEFLLQSVNYSPGFSF